MPSNYWIKLYHEIIDDPKMMKMSEVLFARCIKLFLLAGDHGEDGELPTIEDAAWRLRVQEEELESDLIELQRLGIAAHQDGVWSIAKWDERQGPMTSTERTQRRRAKQKRDHKIRQFEKEGPADVRFGGRSRAGSETKVQRSGPVDTDKDTDTEKEPLKAGKERQPDTSAPFYAVAEQIFGIKATEIPKGTRQHIGRALKALHEVEPELEAPTITDFVSWWRRGKDGAHLPLDPTKLQIHFMAFMHGRQDAGAIPDWTKVGVAYNEAEGTWSVSQ